MGEVQTCVRRIARLGHQEGPVDTPQVDEVWVHVIQRLSMDLRGIAEKTKCAGTAYDYRLNNWYITSTPPKPTPEIPLILEANLLGVV